MCICESKKRCASNGCCMCATMCVAVCIAVCVAACVAACVAVCDSACFCKSARVRKKEEKREHARTQEGEIACARLIVVAHHIVRVAMCVYRAC